MSAFRLAIPGNCQSAFHQFAAITAHDRLTYAAVDSPLEMVSAGGLIGRDWIAALNWQGIALAIAMTANEHRPALLTDADWSDPKSARLFNHRFAAGAPEEDLLAWLRSNDFAVDERRKHAARRIKALPCNERIDVDWNATANGLIETASATVREAGCL